MESTETKLKVLFLCTGNSCRSQMAEGWARRLKGDCIEPYSAGIEAHGLNPRAVEVMKGVGVDISTHASKRVEALMDVPFDYVVTVCGHADANCPVFPGGGRVIYFGFDDPARVQGDEDRIMGAFRRVRDEIRVFVKTLPGALDGNTEGPGTAAGPADRIRIP